MNSPESRWNAVRDLLNSEEFKAKFAADLLKTGAISVAVYVASMARRQGVAHVKTRLDELAKKITELSGDEVKSDETSDLLVALKRAGKIAEEEMLDLLAKHLRETKK